jgi:hypothetical protein
LGCRVADQSEMSMRIPWRALALVLPATMAFAAGAQEHASSRREVLHVITNETARIGEAGHLV